MAVLPWCSFAFTSKWLPTIPCTLPLPCHATPYRAVPQEGVDVLVATPGRVATLLEAGVLNLEDCRAVILDEVRCEREV